MNVNQLYLVQHERDPDHGDDCVRDVIRLNKQIVDLFQLFLIISSLQVDKSVLYIILCKDEY